MAFTSNDVNFLVYRYLLESGFVHSAFAFGHESTLVRAKLAHGNAAPGALVAFVQKGLQYAELEAHVNEDGTETVCDEVFSVFSEHKCRIQNKRRIFDPDDALMDEEFGTEKILAKHVNILTGHSDVVSACQWNPSSNVLVSGSNDGSVRIWDFSAGVSAPNSTTLRMGAHSRRDPVVSLRWNKNGSKIACGTYSGVVLVWNLREEPGTQKDATNGTSKSEVKLNGFKVNSPCIALEKHAHAVNCLSWNQQQELLLSGSIDCRVCVWDVIRGTLLQSITAHEGPILDVTWINESSFVSASTDKTILAWELKNPAPVNKFTSHTEDVNCIELDPSGKYLASCSDDCSVRIWDVVLKTCKHELRDHGREVSALKWGKPKESGVSLLASASFDTTVKLWNVISGTCIFTFSKHMHPVISLDFDPTGNYLVTGARDRVHVWAVKDKRLIKTWDGDGAVSDVCWDSKGNYIAAPCALNEIAILEFRLNT